MLGVTASVVALLLGGPAAAGDDAVLEPYIRCDGFAGGVRAVTLDRRPAAAPPWRAIELLGETGRVSVLDSYRVMYSYPRTLPFARMSVERSDPARYADDKRTVAGYFDGIAQADDNTALVSFTVAGFEVQSLTKKALGGTTLGITQFLANDDAVIVTIYFLNQVPELRRFASHAQFIELRDAFVRGYAECAASRRAAAKWR